MTDTFHPVYFPPQVSFGAQRITEHRTHVVQLASGFEERNGLWAQPRRRYDAGFGVKNLNDIYIILSFFEARQGRLYGFLFHDWADWQSCAPQETRTPLDQIIGVGNGLSQIFQLKKSYISGGYASLREIHKPRPDTVLIAVGGTPLSTSQYTVNSQAGQVTLQTPPSVGSVVTAGFAFDVPVRFETDALEINLAAFQAGSIPHIPLIEIRT